MKKEEKKEPQGFLSPSGINLVSVCFGLSEYYYDYGYNRKDNSAKPFQGRF